jgi:SpoU rRNA methylase family enzyme
MTLIEQEIVPKLRRAISDVDEPYAMTTSLLVEYLEDAVDSIKLQWMHDYSVDRAEHSISPDVEVHHQILFVLKAKLDILERESDNSIRTGSVYITKKNTNEKALRSDIEEAINNILAQECMGVSYTEFDDLENYYLDYLGGIEEWVEREKHLKI